MGTDNGKRESAVLRPAEESALRSVTDNLDEPVAQVVRQQLEHLVKVDRGMVFGRYEAHLCYPAGLSELPRLPRTDVHEVGSAVIELDGIRVDVWLFANRGVALSLEASHDLGLQTR